MKNYRIMFVVSKKDNLESLYKFETTEIDGIVQYKEYDNLTDVADRAVELLSNGYSKDDFIIVTVKDYNIDTDIDDM